MESSRRSRRATCPGASRKGCGATTRCSTRSNPRGVRASRIAPSRARTRTRSAQALLVDLPRSARRRARSPSTALAPRRAPRAHPPLLPRSSIARSRSAACSTDRCRVPAALARATLPEPRPRGAAPARRRGVTARGSSAARSATSSCTARRDGDRLRRRDARHAGAGDGALPARSIPTGIEHGTVTVLVGGEPIEVTTFRGEGAYLDGRRPESVTFHTDLEADLARRDFTMNALALRPARGRVPRSVRRARPTCAAALVRAVGDPAPRFGEDGLRPMRAVRFAAQLGYDLDPAHAGRDPRRARRSSARSRVERDRRRARRASSSRRTPRAASRSCARRGSSAVVLPALAARPRAGARARRRGPRRDAGRAGAPARGAPARARRGRGRADAARAPAARGGVSDETRGARARARLPARRPGRRSPRRPRRSGAGSPRAGPERAARSLALARGRGRGAGAARRRRPRGERSKISPEAIARIRRDAPPLTTAGARARRPRGDARSSAPDPGRTSARRSATCSNGCSRIPPRTRASSSRAALRRWWAARAAALII